MQAVYDPEFYLQAFRSAGSLMPRLTEHLFLGGKDGGTGNGTAYRLKMHPELRSASQRAEHSDYEPAVFAVAPWPMPSVMPPAMLAQVRGQQLGSIFRDQQYALGLASLQLQQQLQPSFPPPPQGMR